MAPSLVALAVLWKLIEPQAIAVGDQAPQVSTAVQLDPGARYKVRWVEYGSTQPFCLVVAESLDGGKTMGRVLLSMCLPAGKYESRFDHDESKLKGGPGHAYVIQASRLAAESSYRVFVRGAIEIDKE